MKKKITALCLAVAMLAVAVIGGTLAYFTDTDEAINVFTVGSIDIVLHEDNANGVADEKYHAWLKDQTMLPNIPVEKDAWVENTGKNSAYVRVKVSVPANLNPVWASDLAQNWIIADTAKGTDATVYTLKYNRVLPAGGNTSDFLTAIVMDEYYNDQSKTAFNVIINVEAIQADGFADAAAAFSALDAQLKVNGGVEVAYVDNAADLKAALAAGNVVVELDNDIAAPAESGHYGTAKTGVTLNGGVIDGNGNTLSATDANTTWDSVIYTTGGTIKNMTVTGGFRGILTCGLTEDLIVDNVVIEGNGICYPFQGNGETVTTHKVSFINSTLNGWTSYDDMFGAIDFTNCKFGKGVGIYDYAYMRPYASTTFTNCEFETGFTVDVSKITGDKMLTFVNCTLNGADLTDDNIASLIGASASTANVKVITFDEEQVVVKANDAADLKAALAAGKVVVLEDDITAHTETGYGAAAKTGVKLNGGVIDGNGNTLSTTDANGTWDSAIYTTGGTIKNMTVTGAFRGILTGGLTEDLIIDNVVVDGKAICYTVHADGSTRSAYKLVVTNSTLNGWTSYSDIFASVEFTNCKFGKNDGGYGYAYCRPYNDTTFTDCVFSEGFEFDATKCTSTFVNCYVGETLITADNVVSLLGNDASNIVVKN